MSMKSSNGFNDTVGKIDPQHCQPLQHESDSETENFTPNPFQKFQEKKIAKLDGKLIPK